MRTKYHKFKAGYLLPALLLLACCMKLTGQQSLHPDPVKIGFLIQDKQSDAALSGAKLAVSEANKAGGYKGRPYELVIRSMEGPWGTGSKQAIDLIFNEKVVAIVGSHDGRNAHLVEQACTKTNVLFISAWSPDPTLAQAFVPWFFNCAPGNIAQANLLTKEIYKKKNFSDILIIKDNIYDNGSAMKFFERQSAGYTQTAKHVIGTNGTDLAATLQKEFPKNRPDCIVLFCSAGNALEVSRYLRSEKIMLPVYSPLLLRDENDPSFEKLLNEETGILTPYPVTDNARTAAFAKAFTGMFGKKPGLVATLAYDAVSILTHAINRTGTDREKMQNSLTELKYTGATGPISFDKLGDRISPLEFRGL
ncbi:MAG: ABC transporter substrate-binding protein [Bacteroidales bacterium]